MMITRNLPVIFLVLVAMFGSIGIRASATDTPRAIAALGVAGETLDAGLHDRVEMLLRTDVGLAGSQFRIQTDNAVVTIAGSVPDELSLRRAMELAGSVKGVREVRNAMEIGYPKL
ncbi:MAG: BON domain-containing protein [Dechloromonas sp.]|nr:MAG: BON domain-containing protein [Dechloromonas sp.]